MTARLISLMFVGLMLTGRSYAQQIEEYQVKAAFLYNFAKFVQWPSQAFKTAQAPIEVCVLGRNPFGDALRNVIRGKSIEGRVLDLRQVDDVHEATGCQILFVSSSEDKHFRNVRESLRTAGMLTVGEAEGFAAGGGVINFKLEDGHVRFEINLTAAEREQLHISSKLLSLAQIVTPEKNR